MFPNNELSVEPMYAPFQFRVKTLSAIDRLQDWEMGGIAINDSSLGLEVQLWHFTMEYDSGTNESKVYVEAPAVAKTLLFTSTGLTEISGCFDQNMNPFVAYQQDGVPKIWWYDPTVGTMVHTTLPAGCIDLRCTLDDKRRFNVANSDIVLSYIRDGALYFRYQRDRYGTEYLLTDEGDIGRLISMAMNTQWRLQWRIRGAT